MAEIPNSDKSKKIPVAPGNAGEANTPSSPPRRPPVTDLLFDTPLGSPRGAANGQGALPEHDRQRPVFHISIVAEMVETHPQTLRMYERMGLIAPQRTRNNIRLYSESDIEQVRRIQHLTQDLGVNLAGVEVVFKLLREMHRLREEIDSEMAARRQEIERELRNL